jgi:uncharacterized membrane protein YhaH (DUF805 family)
LLSMSRPLGRLPFLVGTTVLNTVILLAVMASLAFRPTGGGHLAVLIVVGALQLAWMVLHARRFKDAGKGAGLPIAAFVACFALFAVGYLVMAALWASPEVQREAFRTAGGLGGSGQILAHVETMPFLIDSGRLIAASLGAATSLVLSGMIVVGLGLTAIISGCFSLFALAMPSRKSVFNS